MVPRFPRRSADHFGRLRCFSVPLFRWQLDERRELWVADLESGQRQRLLPDFLMQHYTVSRDGQRVLFVAADDAGRSPVWIATLDRGSAPRQLTAGGGIMAFFGVRGELLFVGREKTSIFLYRVKDEGRELPNVVPAAAG